MEVLKEVPLGLVLGGQIEAVRVCPLEYSAALNHLPQGQSSTRTRLLRAVSGSSCLGRSARPHAQDRTSRRSAPRTGQDKQENCSKHQLQGASHSQPHLTGTHLAPVSPNLSHLQPGVSDELELGDGLALALAQDLNLAPAASTNSKPLSSCAGLGALVSAS